MLEQWPGVKAPVVLQHLRSYVTTSKAESLRSAMLHVRGRFPHPGYWGAFLSVGDWESGSGGRLSHPARA